MRLSVREQPEFSVKDEKFFFGLVKAAFAQRRKTAQNGISAGLGIPKDAVAQALEQIGLQKDIRAEKMTMADLSSLADRLCE